MLSELRQLDLQGTHVLELSEKFEHLELFLQCCANEPKRLEQRMSAQGFPEYALRSFLTHGDLKRFFEHQHKAPGYATQLLAERPELEWAARLHANERDVAGALACCVQAFEKKRGDGVPPLLGGIASLAAGAIGVSVEGRDSLADLVHSARVHSRYGASSSLEETLAALPSLV